MTQAEINEQLRVQRMLRGLRAGMKVRATKRSSDAAPEGTLGVVLDPNVQLPPGVRPKVRRVRVHWEGHVRPMSVLPSSIEVVVGRNSATSR